MTVTRGGRTGRPRCSPERAQDRRAHGGQEFPHQPNCRPSVPAGLNQEIQDFALTVHGTPEIELPPSNYDDHLVQVPAFGRSWPPTLNPPRIGPTEFQDPSSNCLIRDVETTLGKQVLNVPIAQRETAIEPDGMLDDDRWKAVTTVGYPAAESNSWTSRTETARRR